MENEEKAKCQRSRYENRLIKSENGFLEESRPVRKVLFHPKSKLAIRKLSKHSVYNTPFFGRRRCRGRSFYQRLPTGQLKVNIILGAP